MIIRSLLLSLLMSLSSLLWADVSAFVDRTQVSSTDVIQLTLRSTTQDWSGVDLEPLKQDFTILEQNQQQFFSMTNGRSENRYDLVLSIVPKHSGELTIPAFSQKGLSTQSIRIDVGQSAADADQIRDVYLDSSVSELEAYVGQQIIYTLRLYHSVPISDPNLSSLEIADADVQQLGEQRQYETLIRGIRYNVIELNYAVFPEKSGLLEIPEQRLTARTGTSSLFNPLYQSRNSLIQSTTTARVIQVKPKPDSYPAGIPWLPAKSLTLEDSWDKDVPQLQVGQSATRTLTLSVNGLSSAHLPSLDMGTINNIKTYPEQPQSTDNATSQGFSAQTSQSVALVAEQDGTIKLPAIKVSWWNTQTDQLETAQVPARFLSVSKSDIQQQPLSLMPESPDLSLQNSPSLPLWQQWIWQGLTGLFALLWLMTLLIAMNRKKSSSDEVEPTSNPSLVEEPEAFKAVQKACRAHNARQTHHALSHWIRLSSGESLADLHQLLTRPEYQALAPEFRVLESLLFNQGDSSSWRSDSLLKTLVKTRRELIDRQNPDASGDDISLYPL